MAFMSARSRMFGFALASNSFRLLHSGLNIMKYGEPLIRFSGDKLQELMSL